MPQLKTTEFKDLKWEEFPGGCLESRVDFLNGYSVSLYKGEINSNFYEIYVITPAKNLVTNRFFNSCHEDCVSFKADENLISELLTRVFIVDSLYNTR